MHAFVPSGGGSDRGSHLERNDCGGNHDRLAEPYRPRHSARSAEASGRPLRAAGLNMDKAVKFLDVTRPSFTVADAERLARDLYGIAAKAKEFYSERDRIFHLKAGDG